MNPTETTYLSLGSNLNNKLKNLQLAVDAIAEETGKVSKISSVYKTPAWGFSGNDFLNICIAVETTLSPETLLEKLLAIEKKLGRLQKTKEEYENRIIDIDIILYGNRILNSEKLTIPHPKIAERNFVLYPLCDIAAEIKIPLTHNFVSELKAKCIDISNIKKTQQNIE